MRRTRMLLGVFAVVLAAAVLSAQAPPNVSADPRIATVGIWNAARSGRQRWRGSNGSWPTTPAQPAKAISSAPGAGCAPTRSGRSIPTSPSSSGQIRGSAGFCRLKRQDLDRNTLVICMQDNGGEWVSRNAPLFNRKARYGKAAIASRQSSAGRDIFRRAKCRARSASFRM